MGNKPPKYEQLVGYISDEEFPKFLAAWESKNVKLLGEIFNKIFKKDIVDITKKWISTGHDKIVKIDTNIDL